MKLVLIYSGGLDSTCALYHLRAARHDVHALSVDYGQRHRKELYAAQVIAARLNVDHEVVDLSDLRKLLGGSSQTDQNISVPEGHYAEESMKITVVPNRNMLLLSLAAAWATSLGAEGIAYAAHAGDHTIYPDCRPIFVDAIQEVLRIATYTPLVLLTPYIGETKAQIVSDGVKLGVPFSLTWSCYKGGLVHCGKCGTCVERKEAFKLAGVSDPTVYAR